MELKIWTNGIVRTVCGVTEQTTCFDIIKALAYATRKTGHYAMIERSVRSERFLPPEEHPALLLRHFGKYGSEVEFLVRHVNDVDVKQKVKLSKSVSCPHVLFKSFTAFQKSSKTTPYSGNVDRPDTSPYGSVKRTGTDLKCQSGRTSLRKTQITSLPGGFATCPETAHNITPTFESNSQSFEPNIVQINTFSETTEVLEADEKNELLSKLSHQQQSLDELKTYLNTLKTGKTFIDTLNTCNIYLDTLNTAYR